MGLGILINSFILNNMAERVGFYYRHFQQVPMNPTLPR